ncbi:MAG TPA: MFS transporter [bacterium]|nr:MFS transporter [bacterium]
MSAAPGVARPSYRTLLAAHPAFRNLFLGQTISRLGDAVDDIAVIWLVLQVTGSALATATTLAFQILPTLLFGLLAGALVDRWDRRRAMVAMDLVRAGIVLAIPILRGQGLLTLPLLYLLVFGLGVGSQVFRPALRASLPNLVPAAGLMGANSLLEVTRQLGGIVGPGLAGLLIATVGIDTLFYLDAATYAVSALLIALARIPGAPARPTGNRITVGRDILEGIRYLVRARAIFLLALLGILSHLYWAAMPLISPVLAERVLGVGAAGYGVLVSGLNAGMVASGLAIGLLPRTVGRGRLIVLGYWGMGLTAGLLALTTTLWQAAVVLALSGALAMLTVVPFFALLQERVPDEFRGRVFATDETLEHAVLPPFYALTGWLLDTRGVPFVLFFVGAGLAAVGLLALLRPEVREAA